MSQQILELLIKGRNETAAAFDAVHKAKQQILGDTEKLKTLFNQTAEQRKHQLEEWARGEAALATAVSKTTGEVASAARAAGVLATEGDKTTAAIARMMGVSNQTATSLINMGKSPAAFIGAAGALAFAAAGAGKALLDMTLASGKWAEEITNTAKTTGFTVQQVQVLRGLSEDLGVSFGAVTSAATKMQAELDKNASVFRRLGLDVDTLRRMEPGEIFQAVADKVNSLGDQYHRVAVIQEIFGRGAASSLMPLLDAMRDTEDVARRMNEALGDEGVAALNRLDNSADALGRSWETLKNQLSAAIAPSLTPFFEALARGVERLGDTINKYKPELVWFFQLGAFNLAAKMLGEVGDAARGSSQEVGGLGRAISLVEAAQRGLVKETDVMVTVRKRLSEEERRAIAHNIAIAKEMDRVREAYEKYQREVAADHARAAMEAAYKRWQQNQKAAEGYGKAAAKAFEEREAAKFRAIVEQVNRKLNKGAEILDLWRSRQEKLNHLFDGAIRFFDAIGAGTERMRQFADATNDVVEGLGKVFAGAASDNPFMLIGGFLQFATGFLGLFSNNAEKARKELEQLRAEAIRSAGSLDELKKSAGHAAAFIDLAFSSKSPEMFKHWMDIANEVMERHKKIVDGLHTAMGGLELRVKGFVAQMERSGLSVGEINGRLATYKKRLEEAGFSIDEINKKLHDKRKHLEQIVVVTAEDQEAFDRLGRFAVAIFAQLVRETGDFVAALKEIEPTLAMLEDAMDRWGFTASEAFAKLLGVRDIVKANQDLFDSLAGIGGILRGLGPELTNLLGITGDLGRDLLSIYNTLKDRLGGDGTKALVLMQPQLQLLWEHSRRFKGSLDEGTQALLTEAETAGIVGPQFASAMDKVLQVLIAIADVLGAQIPNYLRDLDGKKATVTVVYKKKTVNEGDGEEEEEDDGGGGGGGGPKPRPRPGGFAYGGWVPYTPGGVHTIVAERVGEFILSSDQLSAAVAKGVAMARPGEGASMPIVIHNHIHLDGPEVARWISEGTRKNVIPIHADALRRW